MIAPYGTQIGKSSGEWRSRLRQSRDWFYDRSSGIWPATGDRRLRIQMRVSFVETYLVGHADDVAAFVAARSVDVAQLRLNGVIPNFRAIHGLSLVLNMTEVTILT